MKKYIGCLAFCLLLACQPETVETESSERSKSAYPQRIVTLSPHLAELIFSLGAEDRLIATVAYSDYPEAAKKLPRIGNAFQLDWEAVTALKPDLIIGWQGGNPAAMLDKLQEQGFAVLRLENAELFELPEQIRQLAKRIGGTEAAETLTESYLEALVELQKIYAPKRKIRVFYQISAEPIYTVDGQHTISDMLELCGGENVFKELGKTSAPVTPEAVVGAAPDVIVTASVAYADVVKIWDGVFPAENILSIAGDEVTRASLRMAKGARNICEVLDGWRTAQGTDK